MSENLINVNFRVEASLKKRLSLFAVHTGAKIQELIAKYVKEGLDRDEKIDKKND